MKPLAVLLFVSVSLVGYAQTPSPAKEFAIVLSPNSVDISSNETKEVEIQILRSKSYRNSRAVLGLSSSLPQGIEVFFPSETGNLETAKVIIKSTDTVITGRYSLIINAKLNGKTKASIVKLNVVDKAIASDGN